MHKVAGFGHDHRCAVWEKRLVNVLQLLSLWESALFLEAFHREVSVHEKRWTSVWLKIQIVIKTCDVLQVISDGLQVNAPFYSLVP